MLEFGLRLARPWSTGLRTLLYVPHLAPDYDFVRSSAELLSRTLIGYRPGAVFGGLRLNSRGLLTPEYELRSGGSDCARQRCDTAGVMSSDLSALLEFLRGAERLKGVLRSAHTSTGRRESTAEHTWRLCLFAMVLEHRLGGLDMARVLKLCVVHDLGEASSGDVPAVDQHADPHPSQRERDEFFALWEDYEYARTPEARAVKALDKLETILQHNQGANPPDFDYAFNLHYGREHAAHEPRFAELHALLDADTRAHAVANGQLSGG